jgi:threonine aldolase
MKTGGAAALVGVTRPGFSEVSRQSESFWEADRDRQVNFWVDGVMPAPHTYATYLQKLTEKDSDLKDRYGVGGAVERLEQKFATLTGKERALYLPSGTMANQLAIHVLSGHASKVLVQELSHVFRDEADAAQVVHGRRLVPLAPDRGCFTVQELEDAVNQIHRGEAFRTQIGVVSIENPVRRAEGEVFDINELRRVCAFARAADIRLHLDGARLHLASEYSGTAIDEYAALFDTVYISLYKYLRAPAGAILCGPETVIERVALLRKVHGGDMYQSWPYAAVALHFLEGFADRFAKARAKADAFFEILEATGRFEVRQVTNGSNIFQLGIGAADVQRFREHLSEKWNVKVAGARDDGFVRLNVNETQLWASNETLVEAFEAAHRAAV